MTAIIAILALFLALVAMVVFAFLQNNMIKRLESRVSDLLDRRTAPDFYVYQKAREREQQKAEVVSVQELLEKVEPDGLRVE